jgi:hypothetical protein
MRLLFFILLLANVGVLGYFSLQPAAGGGGARSHPPLRPDAIRIQGEPAAAAAAKTACFEWAGLTDAAFPRAQAALEQLGIRDKLVLTHPSEQWVYIPPLKTRAEAERKLAELKALGVDDGQLVEDDPQWQHAISLAAFGSSEEAQAYLQRLRDKGVKSAKAAERPRPGGSITIVDVDDALRQRLEKLQGDFDPATLRPAACKPR